MSNPSASPAKAAVGSMIFSVFGTAWVAAWVLRSLGLKTGPLVLSLAPGLLLFLGAHRRYRNFQALHPDPEPEDPKVGRRFFTVNIVQGVAIFLAANVTANLGHREWFVPAFIFIVGAHFLPLAALFRARRHLLTGLVMMALAVVYPFVARGGPSNPIGCLGTGLILWVNALLGLFREA